MRAILNRFLPLAHSPWALLPVLLFALGMVLFQLTEAPPTWYDEGMVIQLAQNLALHGHVGTQVAPDVLVSGAYTSSGLPVVLPVAASFLMFGYSLLSARVVMVLFVLALITLAYFLVRRFAGNKEALAAAALLATFSTLYADGKNVLGEVPGLCFLILFLIYAQKFFDGRLRSNEHAFISGLFLGLCVITKPTFLVLLGGAGIAFLYICIRDRIAPRPMTAALGATGVALPVLAWLATQFGPEDTLSRVLAFYGNPYQLAHIGAVMADNALRFLTEATPMYLGLMLLAWAASLFLVRRAGKKIRYAELAAFLFSILIVVAFLRTPGWYRYLFAAQITATLFLPIALARLAHGRSGPFGARALRLGAVSLIVALVALQTYVLFFKSWISTYANSTNTKEMTAYFNEAGTDITWFVYDAPEAVLFLPPGARYYQYIAVNAEGYWGIGIEQLAHINAGVPDRIVAGELPNAAELFPNYTESARAGKLVIFERKSAR